jgi:hypothetical protein
MLTCYGDEVRLPQNDLVYVAFRLAALETLCELDTANEFEDTEDEPPDGFLVEVPLLRQVAPAVQLDLLADVWMRHQAAELREASLLDAAVVFAACRTASRIIHDEPSIARKWLKPGPRRVRCRITNRMPERLKETFFEFWDDVDFLSVSALQVLVLRFTSSTGYRIARLRRVSLGLLRYRDVFPREQ